MKGIGILWAILFLSCVLPLCPATLWNKHLKVAILCEGCYPDRWFYMENGTGGQMTYGGFWGDVLQFVQDARNCSFTFVTPKDKQWGACYGIDNCTGMIGMVNRREADFAITGFRITDDRRPNVDFSKAIEAGFSTVAVPLRLKSTMWYFVHPFTYNVWFSAFFCAILYFFAMVLADRLHNGNADWQALGGFVLRNTLSDPGAELAEKTGTYKKLLVVVWTWMTFVLVQSFSSNLTAILTTPQMQTRLRHVEDLVAQGEISWALEKPFPGDISNWKVMARQSPFYKTLYERAEILELTNHERSEYGCLTSDLMESLKTAAVCSIGGIMAMISTDYKKTGKCNFYLLEDRFFTTPFYLPFQV